MDYHTIGSAHENSDNTRHAGKKYTPKGALKWHTGKGDGGFAKVTVSKAAGFVVEHYDGSGKLLYTAPARQPRNKKTSITAPASPTPAPTTKGFHVGVRVIEWAFVAVGFLLTFFGYQVHSLVFLVCGFLVGWYACLVAYAWSGPFRGQVFVSYGAAGLLALAGALSPRAGLKWTGAVVGATVWAWTNALFLHDVLPRHPTDDQTRTFVYASLAVFLVVFELLFIKLPRGCMIAGTAAVGGFNFVGGIGMVTGHFPSMTAFIDAAESQAQDVYHGGMDVAHLHYLLAIAGAFVGGVLVQWATTRHDEFDLYGSRRWFPTRFRYVRGPRPVGLLLATGNQTAGIQATARNTTAAASVPAAAASGVYVRLDGGGGGPVAAASGGPVGGGATEARRGFLEKQGAVGLTKNKWKTRWCVLERGTLRYFDGSDEGRAPKGEIRVSAVRAAREVDAVGSTLVTAFPFVVETAKRVYSFRAGTRADRTGWVGALNRAVEGGLDRNTHYI